MLSLQPAPDVAPKLVLAVGNPSRGDDALGPRAAMALQALALPGVEVLTDFQLQVEHALDLLGRSEVVFIDAAASGPAPFTFGPVAAEPEARHSSHSLSPAAVLDAYLRLVGTAPPRSRLLAVRGYAFELGAPLSAGAECNLAAALAILAAELREDIAAPVSNIQLDPPGRSVHRAGGRSASVPLISLRPRLAMRSIGLRIAPRR